MFELLADNAATIIIGGILLAAVAAALRHVLKKARGGQCVGCSGCGCGGKEDPHNAGSRIKTGRSGNAAK